MTLKKTISALTKGAVDTAASVARDPIGSASVAAGLVKGTAEAGLDLVRGRTAGEPSSDEPSEPVPSAAESDSSTAESERPVSAPSETEPAEAETAVDPRDSIPGPDLAPYLPPAPEDLPEPIVIEAEPAT